MSTTKVSKVTEKVVLDSTEQILDSVDDILRVALESEGSQTTLLKFEALLSKFYSSPATTQHLNIPPVSKYQRLLLHRLAVRFKMKHIVDEACSDKGVNHRGLTISKTPGTVLPSPTFADLVIKMKGKKAKILAEKHARYGKMKFLQPRKKVVTSEVSNSPTKTTKTIQHSPKSCERSPEKVVSIVQESPEDNQLPSDSTEETIMKERDALYEMAKLRIEEKNGENNEDGDTGTYKDGIPVAMPDTTGHDDKDYIDTTHNNYDADFPVLSSTTPVQYAYHSGVTAFNSPTPQNAYYFQQMQQQQHIHNIPSSSQIPAGNNYQYNCVPQRNQSPMNLNSWNRNWNRNPNNYPTNCTPQAYYQQQMQMMRSNPPNIPQHPPGHFQDNARNYYRATPIHPVPHIHDKATQ